jgi:hypothetical protein
MTTPEVLPVATAALDSHAGASKDKSVVVYSVTNTSRTRIDNSSYVTCS